MACRSVDLETSGDGTVSSASRVRALYGAIQFRERARVTPATQRVFEVSGSRGWFCGERDLRLISMAAGASDVCLKSVRPECGVKRPTAESSSEDEGADQSRLFETVLTIGLETGMATGSGAGSETALETGAEIVLLKIQFVSVLVAAACAHSAVDVKCSSGFLTRGRALRSISSAAGTWEVFLKSVRPELRSKRPESVSVEDEGAAHNS